MQCNVERTSTKLIKDRWHQRVGGFSGVYKQERGLLSLDWEAVLRMWVRVKEDITSSEGKRERFCNDIPIMDYLLCPLI